MLDLCVCSFWQVRLELNGGREITFTSQSEEIPYCDHFLVYLSEGMWDHHLSRATDLEEQLRKAKDKQVPYLLVHEQRTEVRTQISLCTHPHTRSELG